MGTHHHKRGVFSLFWVLSFIVALLVASGPYTNSKALAATAMGDVVYGLSTQNDFQYYRSGAAGTVKYNMSDLGTRGIIDTSSDKQWVLTSQWHDTGTHAGKEELVAISSTGQRVSYGYYWEDGSLPETCTGSSLFFSVGKALFLKGTSKGAPKKIYLLGLTAPCSKGSINYSKLTFRIYTVEVNGKNRKAISSKYGTNAEFDLLATGSNGYALFTTGMRNYVVSSKGKTILKLPTTVKSIYLSGNGKKIAYEKQRSSKAIYVADSNGKHAKKVASLAKDDTLLFGISETGSYVLYQRYLDGDSKHIGIYSYKVSTKKTALIDSGYGSSDRFLLMEENKLSWVAGTSTAIYAKRDARAKTMEIIQIDADGQNRMPIISFMYYDTWGIYLK